MQIYECSIILYVLITYLISGNSKATENQLSNPGIERFQLQTPKERIGKDQKNRFDRTQLSIPPSILHERNISSFNISSILVVSSVSSWVAVPTRKDPAAKKINNTNHASLRMSSVYFGLGFGCGQATSGETYPPTPW